MNRERSYPDWMLRLLTVWPWIVVLIFLATAAGIYLMGRHLDNRLDTMADRVAYEMPPRYALPDLSDHLVQGSEADVATLRSRMYVPVYSHVYRAGGRPYLLEATLSIRNIDPENPVFVEAVHYYDSGGELVRTFLDELIHLAPLETIEYVVEQRHTQGGSGANFIVGWRIAEGVETPLVECVMAGSSGQQAMAFVREGVLIGDAD